MDSLTGGASCLSSAPVGRRLRMERIERLRRVGAGTLTAEDIAVVSGC